MPYHRGKYICETRLGKFGNAELAGSVRLLEDERDTEENRKVSKRSE